MVGIFLNMIYQKNKNLINLVIGQSLLLIGFSIFSTVLFYLLVQNYHASTRIIGLFGIIAALPPAIIATGAPILNKFKRLKRTLIHLQLLSSLFIALSGITLIENGSVAYLAILYLLLSTVSTISTSIEIGFIPLIFDNDEREIEKSVDIQYFSSSVISIFISIIASIILIKLQSIVLLICSFIFSLLGTLFYYKINYSNCSHNVVIVEKLSYLKEFKQQFKQFTTTMPAFIVIIFEAILGSLSGLLLDLLPITMKEIGLSVALFSLIGSIQKIGDFLGGILSPLIKMRSLDFFILDYLLSGLCIFFISINIPNFIRLLLLLIMGVVMGISGNAFEKLMYRSYNVGNISSMHALTTSTFSIFSVIGYLLTLIKVNTLSLWRITGITTIIFGLILIIINKVEKNKL